MAITIKPALRKNPQDKAAAAKYYAQVVLAPEMKQKQIVDQIADRCTLTGSDMEKYIQASEWKNGQKWYHYTQRMRYPTALENADKEQYLSLIHI